MMVVYLDAKATVSAVVRAWRSDYMACSAVRKHFLVVYMFYIELLLLWLNLESPKAKEGLNWSQVLLSTHNVLFIPIANFINFSVVDGLGTYLRYNSRLYSGAEVEHAHG